MWAEKDEVIPLAASAWVGSVKGFARVFFNTLNKEKSLLSKETSEHSWLARITPHFLRQSRLCRLLDTEIDQFLFNGIRKSDFEQFAVRYHWLYSLYFSSKSLQSKSYKRDEDLTQFTKFEEEMRANGSDFEQLFAADMKQHEISDFDTSPAAQVQDMSAFRQALDVKPGYLIFSVLRLKKTTEQMSLCALSLFSLFKNADFETSNVKMYLFAWKMLGFALKKDQTQGIKDKYDKETLDQGLHEIQSNLLFLHHLSTLSAMRPHTVILRKVSSQDCRSHTFRIHTDAPTCPPYPRRKPTFSV